MISQPTDATPPNKQSLRWWQYLLAAAAVALLLGSIFWEPLTRNFRYPDPCLTRECYPTGPSASWQDQFTSADTAARKIDPDAILTNITAYPAAYKSTSWHTNDALEVTFGYIFNGGGSLTVRLWDTDPSNIRIEQLRGGRYLDRDWYSYYAELKSSINESLTQFSISPRQALDFTSSAAKQHQILRGFDIQPQIRLSLSDVDNSAPEWSVHYYSFREGHPANPINILSSLGPGVMYEESAGFTVDIQSGAFVDWTEPDDPSDSSLPRLTPKP